MNLQDILRDLPSVDEIARLLHGEYPHGLIVREAQRVLGTLRARARAGESIDPSRAAAETRAALESLASPSLRRVINATGVVLHTNLGRAPLPAFQPIDGYSNLEYDLATGKRGKRDVHTSLLLERLLGVPAIIVNNNAAATYLVLNELAAGHEVLVSRGELIEIGDGFRIPDIMAASGAVLREVGTTNRTRVQDYAAAISERTRCILRVHPSNFHISGFAAKPTIAELAALAREHKLPLYEDLGSGCLVDLRPFGISEPLASDSLQAGANIITFSGDKLLGGPQTGIIAGDEALVQRVRRNPMFRAMRADKLICQALETSLRNLLLERWEEIPALRMLRMPPEAVRARAERLAAQITGASVAEGQSVAGGGSTPDQTLPTSLVALPGNAARLERKLRLGDPPVIARIERDQLLIDLRTVYEKDEAQLLAAILSAMS